MKVFGSVDSVAGTGVGDGVCAGVVRSVGD